MGAKRTFFWERLSSEKLWYLVGLITSDGCLSPDGRHIDITSKDKEFLEMIRKEYHLNSSVCGKNGSFIKQHGYRSFAYRITIGSKDFYCFLLNIRLKSKKSLILRDLNIPDEHFSHFLRGVIDGDGCIRSWIHPQNGVEQWIVKITSGSTLFLQWMAETIKRLYALSGALLHAKLKRASDLKFGKLAAQELLKVCYPLNSIALPRKMLLAQKCISTRRGWQRSKTVGNFARVVELADTRDSRQG